MAKKRLVIEGYFELLGNLHTKKCAESLMGSYRLRAFSKERACKIDRRGGASSTRRMVLVHGEIKFFDLLEAHSLNNFDIKGKQ